MAFIQLDYGYYDGDVSLGGLPDGEGTFHYSNGNTYIGWWKNGNFHGHGTYYNADGNRYEGEWVNNERHGKGTMFFADGGRCEGEFRYHNFVKGTYYYSDGCIHYGEWDQNFCPHGKGKLRFPNGTSEEGTWIHGKLNGEATINLNTGNKEVGTFVDDKLQGTVTAYLPYLKIKYVLEYKDDKPISNPVYYDYNGKPIAASSISIRYSDGGTYIGSIKNGKKQGKGIFYLGDGRYYEGTFDNDCIHGNGTMIYKNGKRFVGTWDHDITKGTGVWYFPNGLKRTAVFDENGNRISLGEPIEADKPFPENETPTKNKKKSAGTAKTAPAENAADFVKKNKKVLVTSIVTLEYPEGKYVGQLYKGKRGGFSSMYYPDGSYYTGCWHNDDLGGGKGTLYFPKTVTHKNSDGSEIVFEKGCKIVGIWKNSKTAKDLTLVYPDGTEKEIKLKRGNYTLD